MVDNAPGPATSRRHLSPGLVRYVGVRVLASVGVLLAVSLVVFAFVHAAPGGPEQSIGGELATPEQREAIREEYGLNKPLPEQYLTFLSHAVRLDFGSSFAQRAPVTDVIREAAGTTVPLLLITWVFSMVFGIVLGTIAAGRPGGRFDRFVLGATILGASAPVFATGTLLAYLFGVQLRWLPVQGAGEGGLDTLEHLILPALTAATMLLAITTKFSRVRIGQILEEDQMTFARARGLRGGFVLKNVILKNAGVQLVTLSGGMLISLLSGLIIVERVFNLPGIGSLLIEGIEARDIPLVQGVTLFIALVVVTVNLGADLVCLALDPRLRRSLGGAR